MTAKFRYLPNGKAVIAAESADAAKLVAASVSAKVKALWSGPLRAWDTGTLIQSVNTQKGEGGSWYVFSNMDYAPFVEFGTYKMTARPAFGQAFAEGKRRYG